MMFIVALYLPWCRYLAAHGGVQPQLYADNLKCVSRDTDLLLSAARFTISYVWLVGQEPAPSKCVLLNTSRMVRKGMKDWVLSQDGEKGSVNFDVRDLGRHLDTTFRGWSATLATWVRLVISRLVLIFVLPLDFHGRVRVVRSMYIPPHNVQSRHRSNRNRPSVTGNNLTPRKPSHGPHRRDSGQGSETNPHPRRRSTRLPLMRCEKRRCGPTRVAAPHGA